ncbi:MAG: class I SAM-dependent methyltransferase [Paracoccaceae bacterium]|nr:class I SAM-dependent methyltransferase [Paracoccaceae bacterium]
MGGANKDQAKFWSDQAGPDWVANKDMMDAVMANLTAKLVEHANPGPDEVILDIGCGTGASANIVADRLETGRVLATDIAETMLARARQDASSKIDFLLADAQTHDFGKGQFDLVVSRFGTMFFSDPVAAFSNIRRALKPGGRLVMVCWSRLADNPWFGAPARAAIARLGKPAPTDPTAPGPLAFQDADRVLGILAQAGFSDAAVMTETVHLDHPDFETLVAHAAESGPASRILLEKGCDEADKAAITEGVRAEFEPYRRGKAAAVPASLHYFTARNPG